MNKIVFKVTALGTAGAFGYVLVHDTKHGRAELHDHESAWMGGPIAATQGVSGYLSTGTSIMPVSGPIGGFHY